MPVASFSVSVDIQASPETVFAYISDLTRHPEWASDPVKIAAITTGPVGIGSRYRSEAQSHGITFKAELTVTEYDPPRRFGFSGSDTTGNFLHEFALTPQQNGTHLQRKITFDATFLQWLTFLIVLYPIRIPSAKLTLQLLKQRLEQRAN
jgi:uncharacterized protein YndB with AHSA1/START domain